MLSLAKTLGKKILPPQLLQFVKGRYSHWSERNKHESIGQYEPRVLDSHRFAEISSYLIKTHWRNLDLLYSVGNLETPSQCKLCGYKSSESAFKRYVSECIFFGGKLIRHECPSCGVIFGPQKVLELEDELLDMDYKLHYTIFSEGDSTDKIIRSFHLLCPRKDGLYLDYGCGVAYPKALQILREQGYSIIGFEPSLDHSSQYVFKSMTEFSELRFDGIMSHNVLEHLFDPIGTTKSLSDLLNPGGLLVHATPCFEYLFEFTRFHVYFFTGGSLQYLASRAGMKVVKLIKDSEMDYMAAVLTRLQQEDS